MRMNAMRLSFTPTLPCVDSYELTTQRFISPMSSQVWQLLLLCSKERGEAEPVDEEDMFASIDQPQQLQRRRCQIARAYVRLRRQRAHAKAQRSLRRKLNRAYKLQVEAMEVVR